MNKEIPKCACGAELHLAAKGVVTEHFCLQRKMPPAELGLDLCVIEFAKRMQYKLDKNEHKECPVMNPDGKGRGWKNCNLSWLLERAEDEKVELLIELQKDRTISPEKALNECADVGNFYMMIHDNLLTESSGTTIEALGKKGGG